MTLRDDFAADILDGFEDLAQTCIYQPADGPAVSTLALIEDRRLATGSRARGEYVTVRVPMRDVGTPQIDDTFLIAGETWQYRQNQDSNEERKDAWPFWLLYCRKVGSVSLTGGHS